MTDGLRRCVPVLLALLLSTGDCVEQGEGECGGRPVLVGRKEWRARPPLRLAGMALPVSHVIITHTVTPPCATKPQCVRNVQFMQDGHLDNKGWYDIAFNFLVGGDGRVYVGTGWKVGGAHTVNYNTKSVGLAFIGNFEEIEPGQQMLEAAKQLIECGVKLGYLTPTVEVHGHRDMTCSVSPGEKLYRIIRRWDRYVGGRMPEYNCSGA